MTRAQVWARASYGLRVGCVLHLLCMVCLLPFSLADGPAWLSVPMLVVFPVLLLGTYVVTLVTAPPTVTGQRDWLNGQFCIAWLVGLVLLSAANMVLNFRLHI